MPLKFNPFALVTHNGVRAPRVVHHAAHVAIGLVAWAPGHVFGASRPIVIVLALALACYDKHVWFDWHRTSGTLFHPWVPYTLNVADFVSDVGLTMLGALLPPAWIALPVYYGLSTFNDP